MLKMLKLKALEAACASACAAVMNSCLLLATCCLLLAACCLLLAACCLLLLLLLHSVHTRWLQLPLVVASAAAAC